MLKKLFPLFYESNTRFEWLKVLWKCKLSLLAVIILFYVLWINDQGRDLLISLQDDAPLWLIFFTYFLVLVFAGLNWYWPHFYLETTKSYITIFQREKEYSYRSKKDSKASEFILRIVGFSAILVMSGAIFNSWVTEYKGACILYSYLFIAAVFIVFSVIFSNKGSAFLRKLLATKWAFWLTMTLLFATLLVFILFNYYRAHRIVLLSIGFLILGLIYSLAVIFRREHDIYFNWTKWIKNIPVPYVLFGFVYLLMALFILVNIFIGISPKFGPFPMLTLGLLFYIMLINRIYYYIKISPANSLVVSILIIILSVAYFMIPDKHYNVRLKDNTAFERVHLDNYIVNWVEENKDYIDDYTMDGSKFPVFFSSSHGGGSRSAYWTSLITTKLEDTTSGKFSKHLFSLTGASGGSVGSSFFTSFLANKRYKQHSRSLYPLVDSVIKADFLTASITMFFGRDLWASFIPGIKCKDRAAILELEWGESLNSTLDDSTDWFEESLHELYYDDKQINYNIPLLFINTDKVENGQRGILSPVQLGDQFTQAIDMLGSLLKFSEDDSSSIRLSTAALLSARFPYLSPGGRIDSMGYFVDGGYFDNSAGLTGADIIKTFKEVMIENYEPDFYEKFDLYAISIANVTDNSSKKCFNNNKRNKISYLPQLVIPPDAIFHVRDSYTDLFDKRLKEAVNTSNYIRFQLTREPVVIYHGNGNSDTIVPIIPVGRYISDLARASMRNSLYSDDNFGNIEEIIELLDN